jgi:hypothetical protein
MPAQPYCMLADGNVVFPWHGSSHQLQLQLGAPGLLQKLRCCTHVPTDTNRLLCVCLLHATLTGPSASAPQSTPHTILPPDGPLDTPASATAAGSSPQGPHLVDIGPPVMYSVFYEDQAAAEAAGLNIRASWLAGWRVYGPVLFAGCGIMRGVVSGLL